MASNSPISDRMSPVVGREDEEENVWVIPIQAPLNETETQRLTRMTKQLEAKAISDSIDADIAREKRELKKLRPIKILLLGSSESGKSTTLKNFQLMNEEKAFNRERPSWRAVIQYNVVRSIRLIIDALSEVHANSHRSPSRSVGDLRGHARSPSATLSTSPTSSSPLQITPEHLKLMLRLAPLVKIEEILLQRLCPEQYRHKTSKNDQFDPPHEVSVNSSSAWKDRFIRKVSNAGVTSDPDDDPDDWNDTRDPAMVMQACSQDMMTLWRDPIVQKVLATRKIRLEEVSGFYLDSIERVASPRYVPTDSDILRARIKTLGITEYRFNPKSSFMDQRLTSVQWRIYDVGGQRSFRAAWTSYFDDAHAIIFLAAISSFDQVLAEDERVNRLEDSVLLWKAIVSNPVLRFSNIILFLNKCDILKSKLESGIRLADFVISYGRRPNDFESVSNYFNKKFRVIHQEHSPIPRTFYSHFTSVTNTPPTKLILGHVQNTIIQDSLRRTHLILSA